MHPTAVPDQLWDWIRAEFGLPDLARVRRRLSGMMEDPEPVMQQLVRVFIDDGTFCPGFQFTADGRLHPVVTALFRTAMDAKMAHNYFTAWMVTPSRTLSNSRPVDLLETDARRLSNALSQFLGRGPGRRPRRHQK